jgi:RNA polymerase sigma factor (sigma-70 family)
MGPSSRMQSHDESFASAFAAEFSGIHRYLHRRVGARAADDLSAATFETALRNWGRLDLSRPIRPWLFGIATNLLRHHYRSERRMLHAYARSGTDPVSAAGENDLIARLDASAMRQELAAALAALRAPERDVLLLHAWAGLSDSEIATHSRSPSGLSSLDSHAHANTSAAASKRSTSQTS